VLKFMPIIGIKFHSDLSIAVPPKYWYPPTRLHGVIFQNLCSHKK
jgi:hypothetical protein